MINQFLKNINQKLDLLKDFVLDKKNSFYKLSYYMLFVILIFLYLDFSFVYFDTYISYNTLLHKNNIFILILKGGLFYILNILFVLKNSFFYAFLNLPVLIF